MTNPYEVLGISKEASESEIKSAFRSLAKATHPDLNDGNQQLAEQFREIAEAYAVLSDPKTKGYWDSLNNSSPQQQGGKGNSSAYHDNVRATADDIERYIHALYEQMKPYKTAAKKSIAVGMAWLIGGLVVTIGSYMSVLNNGGGTYIITWGAIIFGGIQAIRSFYNYSEINKVLEEAEAKMWKMFE